MARLFTVPLGATARDKFIEEIKALPQEAKPVLVLPNISLLRQVQQETGLRCMSFDYVANRILNMNGYVGLKALQPRQQALIIEDLINSFQEVGTFKYFTNLGNKPGFVKAMAALIGEISKTGLTEVEVNKVFKEWRQESSWGLKDQDIALLYNFYRTYLKDHNWFDLAGKYRLATYVLEGGDKGEVPKLDLTHVYFADYSSFDPLQLKLLKALSNHVEVTIGLTFEADRAEVFGPVQNTYNDLLLWCSEQKLALKRQGQPDCHYFTASFGKAVIPRALADKKALQVYQFTNGENEIKYVLKSVKKLLLEGVRAEDIVITMRDMSLVTGMAEQADSLGIPLALPRSAALALQPLNEVLELAWQSGFYGRDGAEAYLALLSNGLGCLLWGDLGRRVLELRKEHCFASRDKVINCLDEEDVLRLEPLNTYIAKLQGEATVQAYVEDLLGFLDKLELKRKLGTLYQQGKIGLEDLQCALLTEQKLVTNANQLLGDYVACNLAATRLSLGAWLELWRDSLQDQEIAIGIPRFNGVAVKSVTALQGITKDYVFLMGMQEGQFPKLQHESWIYSDKERAALSAMDMKLSTTAEGYNRELFYFATTLGLVGKALVITYFITDDVVASPYVDQLLSLFSDASVVNVLPVRPPKAVQPLREVQQESKIQIPATKLPKYFSASSLETYAKCPFQYLGTKLWGLDDYAPRQEIIDPATEGNLLHKVLEVFLGRYLGSKLTVYEKETLWQQLCKDFETVEQDYIAQEIIYDLVPWRAEKGRVLGLLAKWLSFTLEEQESWTSFTPAATEWSFGFGKEPGLPLALSNGKKVQLQGKVDRLDSNGEQVVVTDYKRSSWSVPSGKEQAHGLDLQLPVYMLAVAKLQHKQVISGNYLVLRDTLRKSAVTFAQTGHPVLDKSLDRNNPQTSKGTEREDFLAENWQQFESFCIDLLTKYIEAIYAGYFPVQPVGSACSFCPLGDICRVNVAKKQDEEVIL